MTNIFNLTYRKNLRRQLTKNFISLIEKNKIPKNIIGTWIRSLHFISPFILLFFVLTGSKYLAHLSIITLFILLAAFIYFNGCILSAFEKGLFENDENITDIFLYLSNYEINNKNRYKITVIIAPIIIVIFISTYFYRFTNKNYL